MHERLGPGQEETQQFEEVGKEDSQVGDQQQPIVLSVEWWDSRAGTIDDETGNRYEADPF